jgi:hypothetical protein
MFIRGLPICCVAKDCTPAVASPATEPRDYFLGDLKKKKRATATADDLLWCSRSHSITMPAGFKPIELKPVVTTWK